MLEKRQLSRKQKEVVLVLFMVLLGAVKQFLTHDLPIMAVPKGIHDDWIMVHLADMLLQGQWLGPYSDLILTKGMFFPLFLAVCNKLSLPYLDGATLFYTVSCVLFVYGVRPLIKKYWAQAVLYLVLLWNPISYSVQAFQRVYRNSISYAQVLLIFGCFIALYLRRKEGIRKQLVWLLGAAAGLTSFFYTREDAIWVIPFLVMLVLVYAGSVVFLYRKTREKAYLVKLLLFALPFFCLWGTGEVIAGLNEKYYGIHTTNELQNSGFSEMYKTMMSVKPEEDIEGVTLTSEKIARMCDASPTLKKIEPYFATSKAYWAGDEEAAKTWEVRDGWVFWIVRTAIAQAGYYENGAMANEICLQIRDELEEALDAGILERQPTMPSTYMSPWRKGYFGKLLGAMGDAAAYTTTYQDMGTMAYLYSEPDENGGNLLFERITGNKTVWYESDMLEFAGWYVFYEGMEDVSLRLEDAEGNLLSEVEFTESTDIADYLSSQGKAAAGADKCRFHVKVYLEDKEQPLYLNAYRGEEQVDSYLLSEAFTGEEKESSRVNIDWYWDVPERHGYVADIEYKTKILNVIYKGYQVTGVIAAILGMLAYAYVCVKLLVSCIRREKEKPFLDAWLLLSALLFSYLVLIGGISYSEISGWNAILSVYLSGAYPLIIGFEACAVLIAGRELWKVYSERRGQHD